MSILRRSFANMPYELAGDERPRQLPELASRLLPGKGDWLELADPARGSYRAAWLRNGRLMGCLFMGPLEGLPSRNWLAGLFEKPELESRERLALLSGQPPAGQQDAGRTVCSCFGVGENTIVDAIVSGCVSPEAVTSRCQAGGNCGSCLPEIQALITRHAAALNRRSA
jgi:assimilatory nitrate reductase catalytic subunit